MTARSICMLGGTGFVGSRLAARLVADGHRVRILTRNREVHRHLLVLPELNLINANVHDAGQLAAHFQSTDVVVNLVGILNERGHGGAGFRLVHTELARKVVGACRSSAVPRLLHMSALKADAKNAPSHYLRTKGEAEDLVRAAGNFLDYTILRPSVIFGPRDSFINRFAHLLRMIPGVLPLARAGARFAPVFVDDVVEAFARCIDEGSASRTALELCGPEVFTLRDIVSFVARTIGRPHLIMGLPDALARVQALIMDFVPGKPFSTDNYRSLTIDSVCAQDGFAKLGIQPRPMHAIVQQYLGAKSAAGLRDVYRNHARRA